MAIVKRLRARLCAPAALAWLVAACAGPTANVAPPLTPAEAQAGLQTATAQATGLDPARLQNLLGEVAELGFVDNILVLRNGCVVAERYFDDKDPTAFYRISSVSKLVVSALTGIAIREAVFRDVDQPLAELLPRRFAEVEDDAKRAITLRHLLTMKSGLASTDTTLDHFYWRWSSDPAALALEQPMESAPGEAFRYSTGNAHLIAVALAEKSGEAAHEFAERHLFGPAGIRVSAWTQDGAGHDFGGIGMRMTARNLARFGYLYAHEGRLGDRQVIPAAWVAESTRAWAQPDADWGDYGYGYGWWLKRLADTDLLLGRGYGGQTLAVVPAVDLVLVAFGDYWVLESTAASHGAALRALIEGYVEAELRAPAGSGITHCVVAAEGA